jgi:hypothetical protein
VIGRLTPLRVVLWNDGNETFGKQQVQIFFDRGATEVEFVADLLDANAAQTAVAIGVARDHVIHGDPKRADAAGVIIDETIIYAVRMGTGTVAVGLRHEEISFHHGNRPPMVV